MTSVAEFFTVVTGAIAVIAVLGSVSLVTRAIVIVRLFLAKLRIALVLRRSAPAAVGSLALLLSILKQAHSITGGARHDLAEELKWLSTVSGSVDSITFDLRTRGSLTGLSKQYGRVASGLQIRTLLFGGSQPVLEHVARVARQTASSLGNGAINLPLAHLDGRMPAPLWLKQRTSYRSERPEVVPDIPSVVHVEAFELEDQGVAHELHVSWIVGQGELQEVAPTSPRHPRQYNGLLPRLTRHRYERSVANGNYRLHLELGDIFYEDHLVRSDPRSHIPPDESDYSSALLTLSVLPLTIDGYLIVAKRGDIAYYPKCWGPGAGGNLEIPTFGSAVEDLDEYGVIDPLKAVVRETREELGLVLDTSQVQPLGLARISNAEEHGTFLMPALAMTGLTLPELARATAHSNAVSGRWEIGDQLAAVPAPRTRQQAANLLSSAIDATDCMPHLVANLMQFISFATPLRLSECLPAADRRRSRRKRPWQLPEGSISFAPGSETPGGRPPQ